MNIKKMIEKQTLIFKALEEVKEATKEIDELNLSYELISGLKDAFRNFKNERDLYIAFNFKSEELKKEYLNTFREIARSNLTIDDIPPFDIKSFSSRANIIEIVF